MRRGSIQQFIPLSRKCASCSYLPHYKMSCELLACFISNDGGEGSGLGGVQGVDKSFNECKV